MAAATSVDSGLLDTIVKLVNVGFAGVGFAVFCGVMAVAGPLLAPTPVIGKPAHMLLNFSPSFATQNLPAPRITLPDGSQIVPGASFDAESGQVLVSVDDALSKVATLKQTALTLAETATAAQKQADSATAALAQASGPPPAPVASAQAQAAQASTNSQVATTNVTNAIKAGRFEFLVATNRNLSVANMASIQARDQFLSAAKK